MKHENLFGQKTKAAVLNTVVATYLLIVMQNTVIIGFLFAKFAGKNT